MGALYTFDAGIGAYVPTATGTAFYGTVTTASFSLSSLAPGSYSPVLRITEVWDNSSKTV